MFKLKIVKKSLKSQKISKILLRFRYNSDVMIGTYLLIVSYLATKFIKKVPGNKKLQLDPV